MSLLGDILGNLGHAFGIGNNSNSSSKTTTTTTTQRPQQQNQTVQKTVSQPSINQISANSLQKVTPSPSPTTTTTTTVAPKKNSNPNPVQALGNFAGQTLEGLINGLVVNPARLVGDVTANAVAHATNNKAGIAQFNKSTADDYNNSVIAPAVNTVKLIPDAAGTLITGDQKGFQKDLNSSFLSPIVGVDNGSVQDTIQKLAATSAAQSTYQDAIKANNETVKRVNAGLANGTYTQEDAQRILNTSNQVLNQTASDASGALRKSGSLDPATVASNAANTFLTGEGAAKGISSLKKSDPNPVVEATNNSPATSVASGVHSVNPQTTADVLQKAVVGRNADGTVAPSKIQSDPAPLSSFSPDDGTPAINRRVDPVQENTVDTGPVLPDVSDVPAILRKSGAIDESTKQARVDELNTTIKGAPDASQLRAAEYQLRQNYSAKLRERPDLGPQLKKELTRQLNQMKADSDVVESAKKERDQLMGELSDAHQQGKMAQVLQSAQNEPVKNTPTSQTVIPKINRDTTVPVKSTTSPAPVKSEVAQVVPAKTTTPKATVPSKVDTVAQKTTPVSHSANAAKTGEMAKSQGKFGRGQQYEKASIKAAQERGDKSASTTSYDDFVKNVSDKGEFTTADRDTAVSLQKRFNSNSDEYKALDRLIGQHQTNAAQALATAERVARRTASPKALTDRLVSKVYRNIDENANISDKDFKELTDKNQAFVDARDAKNKALDTFNGNKTKANANAYQKAYFEAENADKLARQKELSIATQAAKGSKSKGKDALLRQLKEDAGVYTMNGVDASLLSSTRVMFNNFVNSGLARGEEQLGGKLGAVIGNRLTKLTQGVNPQIGGGSIRGGRFGAKVGDQSLVSDVKARASASGNGLVKAYKNVVTTGNTLGERNIAASTYSGVYDHYRQVATADGLKGEALEAQARVNSLEDPDNVVQSYHQEAQAANGLSSTTGGRQKIETTVSNGIAHLLGDSKAAKTVGNASVRLLLGFPTVIAKSGIEGAKRATLGSPEVVRAVVNIARKGDPEVTAKLIKSAVKEAGSGAAMIGAGAALGAMGLISGSYPSDKSERDQWTREGKTEHSINIGGNWYSLPSSLGVFALPFMLGANAGSNVNNGKSLTNNIGQTTLSTLIDSMPTDTLSSSLSALQDFSQGNATSFGKWAASTGASAVKILTPASGLINEIGKMVDPTVNDTSKGTAFQQFIAKVMSGNPVTTNLVSNKVVDGNNINNPNPVAIAFGAASADQSAGKKTTADNQVKANDAISTLKSAGALTDDVRSLLSSDDQTIFDNIKNGSDTDQKDIDKITKAVKSGFATPVQARIEDGKYDKASALLKSQLALEENDENIPDDQKDTLKTKISQLDVAQNSGLTYDDMKLYNDTTLAAWRNMGDSSKDSYDPTTYKKLYDIDIALAKAGVAGGFKTVSGSTAKTSEKQKYSAKDTSASDAKKAASAAAKQIKSNTIGNLPSLPSLTSATANLAPKKITDSAANIPILQKVQAGDLIKKRAISVK